MSMHPKQVRALVSPKRKSTKNSLGEEFNELQD